MRVGIVGSRHFNKNVDKFASLLPYIDDIWDEVISGGAKGVDSLAKEFAEERGIKFTEFNPDGAGPFWEQAHRRNQKIVDRANYVIAFWDGRTKNCGTLDTMSRCIKAGKKLYIVGVKS